MRQQLIKLRVASRVATPFYLTLDADNICCKPVSYAQLVPDGRALMTMTRKGVHPDWWRQSAKILGVRPQIRRLSPRIWKPRLTTSRAGMSVTPALLSTRHVLELTKFIEERWKSPFGEVLSDHRFTEYSLYYLFLEMRDLVESVHRTDHPVACRGAGANVWSAEQFEAWDTDRLFNDTEQSGFFTVCQSNTGIPAERIWGRVKTNMAKP